ncbi:MAG: hypothetical protein WD055_04055 [Candidatus Dependentiae bacterium]
MHMPTLWIFLTVSLQTIYCADNNIFADITLDSTFLKEHTELMQPKKSPCLPLLPKKTPQIKITPAIRKETEKTKSIKKVAKHKHNKKTCLPNEEKKKQLIEWLYQDFIKNFNALTPEQSNMIFISLDNLQH